MIFIDLNADLGEGVGNDDALLEVVSSASIACGGHAGDVETIRRVLLQCKARDICVGAHPGYADRARFGRVRLDVPRAELKAEISSQVALVRAIAHEVGVPLHYVKLHGALANQAAEDFDLAVDLLAVLHEADPELAVLALDRSRQVDAARHLGMTLMREAYADRAYTAEGQLVARSEPGAVIHDEDVVIERCLRLALVGEIVALDGTTFSSTARSICLHGDTPGAADLARAVRRALEAEGITIAAGGRVAPDS